MVGIDLLVILDGACEPIRGGRPTSLELARTPALDALATEGALARARTVPSGLAPGSETAIPTLLGHPPVAPVDRGAIEAAAHDIAVGEGQHAWRVDVRARDGGRADRRATDRARDELSAACPAHAVHQLAGHRLLVVGPGPLPGAARRPPLHAWPAGTALPRVLTAEVLVIGARGAAVGIACLLGATGHVPEGATGDVDSDLAAKRDAALASLDAERAQTVVHVGGADEASHRLDPGAKIAFLERVDRELIGPLADAVAAAGATLRVCPDHGCDPVTGRHVADPVPHLTWTAARARPATRRRLTERTAAVLDVTDLTIPGRTLVPT